VICDESSIQRQSPGVPSPCRRLSRPPSTMTPPTLTAGIGGLLTFASRREPPTFTKMTSARSGRWRFPINLTRALRDPERRRGKPGNLSQPSSSAAVAAVGRGNPSRERILPGSFATPSCRVLRQGGFFPSVAIRFGWTHHTTSSPSPPILVACIAPQGAFQGQLFHPRLASTWRDGPTVHRLPGRGDGSTDCRSFLHVIFMLRGAPLPKPPLASCVDRKGEPGGREPLARSTTGVW
jgi:hypothetical protein